ncbi:hypothetical protein GCM10010420_52590 [Streptomyces glaucosporus]|uniref:DUF397 domain-containing protein n=1 Tax=Streptomyces glaucosporus TaxID=284044 RepID=A0ABN3IYG2_9ACTN
MSTGDELNWFKSSYSGSQGDSCVEVAYRPETVYVRDSKEQDGPVLPVSPTAWTDFLAHTAR